MMGREKPTFFPVPLVFKLLSLFGLGEKGGVGNSLGHALAGSGGREKTTVSLKQRWMRLNPPSMLVTVALSRWPSTLNQNILEVWLQLGPRP